MWTFLRAYIQPRTVDYLLGLEIYLERVLLPGGGNLDVYTWSLRSFYGSGAGVTIRVGMGPVVPIWKVQTHSEHASIFGRE